MTADSYSATLEQICIETIRPDAPSVDRDSSFPSRGIAALSAEGFLGAISATDVGGLELGLAGTARVIERVAQECASTAMVLCMHYCGTLVLESFGPRAVRKAAATGAHLSTLAFSEVGSRSHFWAPVGTATATGAHVVLNAHKSWITSASHAAAYVWSSRPVQTERGFSTLWLVPVNSAGLEVHGRYDGLGLRGNDSSSVSAQDVRVPETAMLGKDGKGFDIMLDVVLPTFNVLNAACSVGIMEAVIQKTVLHASRVRYADSDAALADLPTIRNYLARMRIQADMAHALLEDTIAAVQARRSDAMLRVLSCKAAASEAVIDIVETAMRIAGGAAYRKEMGIERHFRDAHASGIMSPTTDVLYDFIGKAMCGMRLCEAS